MKNDKPIIVISAERFFQGGSVVIVNECLKFLSENLTQSYQIKALVFQKDLYDVLPGIEFVEFPRARKTILLRLYYEYFLFKKYSNKWKPHLWFSLQDSTPNVQAKVQAIYYHNPLLMNETLVPSLQPRLLFLWMLYKFIYIKGINRNDFIIVQQQAMANFFEQKKSIEKSKLLIFPPVIEDYNIERDEHSDNTYIFIFPATPYSYKNYDIIFEACRLLKMQAINFKIQLTILGEENNYIKKRKEKYNCEEVVFLGVQKRSELFALYNKADCMIFPSLMETWGLPLTEFRQQDKPIICADLPYAKETLANYDFVKFFNPKDAVELAQYMLQAINGTLIFDKNAFFYKQPIIENWQQLFDKLLNSAKQPS